MKYPPAAVVHLNVTGFPGAVCIARDRSLADTVFVVGGGGSRALVRDVSPRARQEGLEPGMNLGAALRRVRNLTVIPPDPASWAAAGEAMEKIARRYAPVVENDSGGHLYLDLAGTTLLFGPPEDCAARIRGEIAAALNIDPTVAVAGNKLTAKVATRTLRPAGFALVRRGDEAAFLAPQDLRLLPGIGPALARLLAGAGIRDIGSLAALDDDEARILLGRRGGELLNAARGIDEEPVQGGSPAERGVRRRLTFNADVLDAQVLRGALMALTEDAGMELRRRRFGARRLDLAIGYADGGYRRAGEGLRRAAALDGELFAPAERCLIRAADRRLRVQSLDLALGELTPDPREQDLFDVEKIGKQAELQSGLDDLRRRFGSAAPLRGTALLARNFRA